MRLLDVRPARHCLFSRWIASGSRNGLDQQCMAVRHPVKWPPISAVDDHSHDLVGLCTLGGTHPQLNSIRGGVGKGESLAVGAPFGSAEFGIGGKRDPALSAV